MLASLHLFGALFVSIAFLIVGNGLFQTLISVYLGRASAPAELTAIILSAYYVGFVLGSLRGPVVVSRVGHVRAFAAFTAIVVIAALLHPIVSLSYWWAPLRLLAGFAMAGAFVVIESWLNDKSSPSSRGAIMSLYMIINYAALACGQFLLTLGDPNSFFLFSLAGLAFAAAIVPLGTIRIATPTPQPVQRLSVSGLYAVSPLGFIGVTAVGFMNGAFYSLAPIYAGEIGLDQAGISWFMGAVIVGGLALQYPVGRLSDRFDRRKVLIGVATATALGGVLFVLSAVPAVQKLVPLDPWIYVVAAIYGGCAFTLYPVLVAHAQDFATPDQRVGVSAGMLLCFGVGAAAGPAIATAPMAWVGPSGLFVLTGATAVGLSAYAVYRMRRRESLPSDQKQAFVAMGPALKGASGVGPQIVEPPEPDYRLPDPAPAQPKPGGGGP